MRIAVVTPLSPPDPGGPSYYSVALGEAFERAGHTVEIVPWRMVRHLPSGIRHAVFFFRCLRAAQHADILLLLDTVSVAFPAVLAAKIAHKPTVIRTGGDFVWERFIERTGEKVLLSEFYMEPRALSFKERVLLWLERRVVFPLTTLIVYSTAWQRDIWRAPYGIPDHATAIVENHCPPQTHDHVGGGGYLAAWRPTGFKNIDTLEAAYAQAKERDPHVLLTIFRSIPREELHEHMRSARALIVPSLSEVSPNMALEALAMGLPVLLTQDCGMRERLEDVVEWIDPLDPNDLADRMCALLDDATYDAACARARSFTYTRTYDDIARDFLPLFKKVSDTFYSKSV